MLPSNNFFAEYVHFDNIQRLATVMMLVVVSGFAVWLSVPHNAMYGQSSSSASHPSSPQATSQNSLSTIAVDGIRIDAIEKHQAEQDRKFEAQADKLEATQSDVASIKAAGATVSAVVLILGILGLLRTKQKP